MDDGVLLPHDVMQAEASGSVAFEVRVYIPDAKRTPISHTMRDHLRVADGFFAGIPEGAPQVASRAAYDAMARHFSGTRPGGVRVRDVAIERPSDALASGAPLGIRVYEPPPQAGSSSGVILYFHGGGFALGDLDSHDTIVADLSAATGLTAVAVDYARVPEYRFPAALQDARTAWLWLTSNTGEMTIDPDRIILAGDSCGATLAANLALSAHHLSDQFNPAGQVLIYPVLGADFETPSYRVNANAPNLTRAEMIACWDAYLPLSRREDVAKRAIPNRSDVPATLAPAAILTAAHDPVCDDGAVYATRLGGNGIATAYRCDADLPHGHLRARREDPSAQRAFAWICQATRQLINGVRCDE